MSNAMSAAFERAGIRSTEERLQEIALKAMVAHADDLGATVEEIWSHIQRERALMAALFGHGWRREVSALIYRTKNEIRSKERTSGLKRAVERKAAKVVNLLDELDRREEERERQEEAEAQAREMAAYNERMAAWKRTQIGTLEIDGKPIWQCTAATARSWLQTQKRRWATVEQLIEGLPRDRRPIEYYRRPEDVADIWESTP